MIFRIISISIVIVFFFGTYVHAGEAEDRIAEFLARQSEVEACVSVLISRTQFSEWMDRNLNGNLAASQIWQRIIVCKETNEFRMDGMRTPLGENYSTKEAQLIAGGECLYWTSSLIQPKIQQIEMRVGRPMRGTLTRRVNPFRLPIALCATVYGEYTENNAFHETSSVVEEYELKNGQYCIYLVPTGEIVNGGYEVTFAKEPRWAPVKFRLFDRGSAPKPSGALTAEIIKSWTLINTTVTEWQPIDDEPGWLPSKVNMESDDISVDNLEFLLTDWKLGKDVDRSPLQKSQFTPQNIPKQIDFDKVVAAFDEMRAKQKKSSPK